MTDDYFAGFLDGEGYIGVVPAGRNGSRRLTIAAEQKDPRPLEMLAARFGGVVHLANRADGRRPHRSQVYYWHVYNRIAANVLRSLRDMLVVKQAEADLALAFVDLMRPVKAGVPKFLTWEERAERDAIDEALREWRASKDVQHDGHSAERLA